MWNNQRECDPLKYIENHHKFSCIGLVQKYIVWEKMVSVVGEMFCNPYTTELVVRRRRESLKRDRYDVFDLSDNLIFTVDGGIWNIRRKRVLRDATGTPLLSMRTKVTHIPHWSSYLYINILSTKSFNYISIVEEWSHVVYMKFGWVLMERLSKTLKQQVNSKYIFRESWLHNLIFPSKTQLLICVT